MWFFFSFVQILPHNIIHKHNQIKNLQKLQLDTKQTDIKMLWFLFFVCFFHIVIAHHLKNNNNQKMATCTGLSVAMCKSLKSHSSHSVWTIYVKYFFFPEQ